jgi:hypothetical protein
VKGLVVSVPRSVVPLKNWTRVTEPSESAAVAARLIDAGAVNVAPVDGLVSDTVGNWFEGVVPCTATLLTAAVVSVLGLWLVTAIQT